MRRQGTVNVTVPVRRIQRNSHCSQLCPQFCPSACPHPFFLRDRFAAPRAAAAVADRSLLSQSQRADVPVCRSSQRWARLPDLPGAVQSSKKLMCYVFCVQADPAVAFVEKVLGRGGVHSLSQVLSTVLVLYFIFCFDVVMI